MSGKAECQTNICELCRGIRRQELINSLGTVQVKEVKALIGYFDLDPKRVYDVVLEAYEHMPHQEAFLQLTGLFSQDARTQILGFRFVRLAKDDPVGCDALHHVTAQLIKVGSASSCVEGLIIGGSTHVCDIWCTPRMSSLLQLVSKTALQMDH